MKQLKSTPRVAIVALLAVSAFAMAASSVRAQAPAGSLWYNGDWDLVNGLANETNTQVSDARVYDNFIIPAGQTWNISALFSRDLVTTTVSSLAYEIRSGVSSGNGGTLLFSGTTAAFTQAATGRTGFGFNEFTLTATGLNITLPAGTYWLAVVPVGNGAGRSFISTTNGAGSVGMPPGTDGNAFFNSAQFTSNFVSTTDPSLGNGHDFSMGVIGRVVPEPATWSLLATGLGMGIVALRRRRRSS
ncbi:MAG: PEP-CTERM sorting domain-containing protein [Chthoniobacterales bacterium]